ncbi:MerR family transcriptional regulator [Cellulomonas cellasea]|uniref:HTH merR-type domain-containing protein n=2 Tax=Cellulomonas cellasea TaxID=43670 RepID=A0A0A0B8V0_9CELL|nr:MerR family transcriptional regulator [Cellulomonas cellasea]KGM02623.1 hypothetical protein Q760_12510 [Cellulomonas cellasea DSM 20118]GEA87762.1 MerR family transcriptional regulator [Cellulomonas cellasea]
MTTTHQPPALLTIGQLAERSGLSLKALRLYDELGLLPPARVDPASGYRYYDAGQLDRARLIGLLRQVRMPLADIGALLADRDPERLRAWWRAEADDHQQREGVVRYLLTELDGAERPVVPVLTRHVPDEKVATTSAHVLQPDLPRYIPEAIGRLRAHLEACGATARDIDWTVYHSTSTTDSAGLVEVCVPFSGTVQPTTEVTVRVEPAHHEAYARITKGEVRAPHIMYAFDAVAAWVAEHGHTRTLDPREVYFADWVAVDESTPAVDIAFPFAPAGGDGGTAAADGAGAGAAGTGPSAALAGAEVAP